MAACFYLSMLVHHINDRESLDFIKLRWHNRFGKGNSNVCIVVLSIGAITQLLVANFPTPVWHDTISGLALCPVKWISHIILVSFFSDLDCKQQ